MLKSIRYIVHSDINKEAWDNCIDNALNQLIYAYSWYLDAVSPGWDALVLGNYEAIMPLTHRKRFTLSYLAQPLFTQQLGVFYTNLEHMNATNDFLNAIPEKFKLIELNLNTFNVPSNPSFTSKQNVTCHLELHQSYGEIVKNYSKQVVRNLKKAHQHHLRIADSIEVEQVIQLFKQGRGSTLKKFGNKAYQLLIKLVSVLKQANSVQCLGVLNNDGVCIAGALFVIKNESAIFLFSGVNTEAKTSGAMSLLIDHFIEKYAQSNITFDFEGSNDANLARFYLGFGSKEVHYYGIRRNKLPKIIRWVKG